MSATRFWMGHANQVVQTLIASGDREAAYAYVDHLEVRARDLSATAAEAAAEHRAAKGALDLAVGVR